MRRGERQGETGERRVALNRRERCRGGIDSGGGGRRIGRRCPRVECQDRKNGHDAQDRCGTGPVLQTPGVHLKSEPLHFTPQSRTSCRVLYPVRADIHVVRAFGCIERRTPARSANQPTIPVSMKFTELQRGSVPAPLGRVASARPRDRRGPGRLPISPPHGRFPLSWQQLWR